MSEMTMAQHTRWCTHHDATKATAMYDLTLETPVTGTDEPIGRLTGVVCHPTTNDITHLVVNADDVPGSERLVPIDRLADADAHRLTLAMSRHRFFHLKSLETVRLLAGSASDGTDLPLSSRPAGSGMTFALHERIPTSDLALRRRTKVVDRRGNHLGYVHAFAVDPASHGVTHLTLQRRHLMGHQQVTLPATDIATMTEDAVVLRIDADDLADHAVTHGPLGR